MPEKSRKSVRKLVTLPADLAERVESFRASRGASSESDALKALIEDGLKMRDKPEDLFQRCETSTLGGQSIGDIINLVTSDHPLVHSTVLDDESLIVYLRHETDARVERFRFSRSRRTWTWEWEDQNGNWRPVEREQSGKDQNLDDEIPF